MKYCSSCGRLLNDNTIFCPVCGQRNEVKTEPASAASGGQSYSAEMQDWGYTQAVMPSQSQPAPRPEPAPQPVQQPYDQTLQTQSYGQTVQPQPYGQTPEPEAYSPAAEDLSAGQTQDPYYTLSYLNRPDQPQPALRDPQPSVPPGYQYGTNQVQTPPRPIPVPDAAGPYYVDPDKEKKEKPNVALIVILAALFAAGMLTEILMKVSVARNFIGTTAGLSDAAARGIFFRRFSSGFSTEADPIYALLIYLMRVMRLQPKTAFAGLLRWFPYLVLFFLPVLAALVKKKGIPLIVCGGFTLLEGLLMLLSGISSQYVSAIMAVPFIFEGIIVALLAVGFFTKNKPLLIAAGASACVLAILTPFVSPAFYQMIVMMLPGKQFFTIMRRMVRHPHRFEYMSGSYWPVFKLFSLLMYAVLAFFSLGSIKKEK